jgi:hypothetical protein
VARRGLMKDCLLYQSQMDYYIVSDTGYIIFVGYYIISISRTQSRYYIISYIVDKKMILI